MANPPADFPTSIHTDTDTSLFAAVALGSSSPTHVQLEGKQEEEIKAVETKVGTGASTPIANSTLRGTGTGTSAWQVITNEAGYIAGLNPVSVSTTVLGATPGACYIESLGAVLYGAPSNITPSSPTASTWYHVYAFSNSGTLTLEASTTAPVAFATPLGTAMSKTGDTSRRYLYSALTTAGSVFYRFDCNPTTLSWTWMNAQLNTSIFRVLSSGNSNVSASVNCAGCVPVTARQITIYANNGGAQSTFITSDDYTASSSTGVFAIGATLVWFGLMPCSSAQKIAYIVNVGGSGVNIDVLGFTLSR